MGFTSEDFVEAKRIGAPYAGQTGSATTLRAYKNALVRAEGLVGKPIADFGPKDADKLLRAADKAGYSQSTKNQTIAALKGIFDWAIGNDLYDGKNPFGAVKSQEAPHRLPRVLSVEEIERLFAAITANDEERRAAVAERNDNTRHFRWATEDWGAKYVLILKVMAYGGLRIGEALGLKKRDVGVDGVRVVGKGNKERWVPLKPEVLDELHSYATSHPYTSYVFYGEAGRAFGIDQGKPMNPAALYKVFAAGVERAGLPKETTPHTLRHSFATTVGRATGRIEIVQDLLGHADPKTTRRYMQLSREDLSGAYRTAFG